jgi:hypothetical protein
MEYNFDKIIFVSEFENIAYILQNKNCEWNSWVDFFYSVWYSYIYITKIYNRLKF